MRLPIWLGLLATADLGLAANPASAQVPAQSASVVPGFYLGAELGGANYDNGCDPAALSCDRRDTTLGAFAGYRLDSRFLLELGWHDLGEARAIYPRLTSTTEVTGDVKGYDLSALFRLPVGRNWEGYVRGGAFYWEARTRSVEFSTDESDWSATAGVGLAWQFHRSWQARFQFLFVSDVGGTATGRADVQTLALGLCYTFGSHRP